jgi:aminopeptidase N
MNDVVQNPSTLPPESQQPDVAPPPKAPATIFRKDYHPPAWLVPEIALDFALGLETTRVRATLQIEKNPAGDGAATIRLNGDGINVASLELDGQHFNSWAMDRDDLLIDLPGDKHTLTIETRIHPAANSQLSGLYASNGLLCTQCEAEGVSPHHLLPRSARRAQPLRGRLSGDTSGSRAPRQRQRGCPRRGPGARRRRHPLGRVARSLPKPSYLFALVAGELVANRDASSPLRPRGRPRDLGPPGDERRTAHAMASLKAR